MTATVNASTSAGVIVTSDTSGALALQTAGTTALTISSAQAITVNGLITSTVGNSGFILRGSTATNSYIYPVYVTNTSGGVQLALEGATSGNVLVGGTAYATVLTTTTNTPVEIGINTTRVGSFSSTGLSMVQSIGVGNTTPSSSGAGISFPATQSASSDANTLDDYEEGTWTPIVGVGFTGVTYSSQHGWYTKVGRSVVISGRVNFSGTANFNNISITNMPFTMATLGGGAYGGGGIPYADYPAITNTSPYVGGGNASVQYYSLGTGSAIASGVNASGNWISFIVTIAT